MSAPALWFGTATALIGVGSALQAPDASVRDGDPCCPHPDSWRDVVLWLGGSVVLTVGLLALGYLAFHGLRFAAAGNPPAAAQQRRLVRAVIVLAGALLALATAWVVAAA